MPSKKLEPPLHIELTPSRRLLLLLLIMHGGAILFVLLFPVTWPIKVLFLMLLMISTFVSVHKTGWTRQVPVKWRLPQRWRSVSSLVWQGDNDWQLLFRDGHQVLAQLLPSSTCQAYFVSLNFRTEKSFWPDRYLSVVIFPDAIDAEIFRQLRIRLRTRFVPEPNN